MIEVEVKVDPALIVNQDNKKTRSCTSFPPVNMSFLVPRLL
jgi:hypothetical protein